MTENATPKSWYALKVFYNKVFHIEKQLNELAIDSYIPMRIVEQVVRGAKVRRRRPAVNSLMFVCCTEAEAKAIRSRFMGQLMLYSDRETRAPQVIPDEQMQRFIRITSVDDLGLEYLGEVPNDWCSGQRVRVTGGLFRGQEGYIKRVRGDHRLVVAIEGIVAVATSYIPSAFLERIETTN